MTTACVDYTKLAHSSSPVAGRRSINDALKSLYFARSITLRRTNALPPRRQFLHTDPGWLGGSLRSALPLRASGIHDRPRTMAPLFGGNRNPGLA